MCQLTLEHQGEEIAADRAGVWQAVFRSQHDFGRESEDFPVNWGTYHSRHGLPVQRQNYGILRRKNRVSPPRSGTRSRVW